MSREYFQDIEDQLAEQAAAERQEYADAAAAYVPAEVDRPDRADLAELTALQRAEDRRAREKTWGRP